MTRIAAAAVLLLHGAIHLIGFVVPWRLATVDGFPLRATALDGAVVLGDGGARAIGLVWLVLVIGFVAAAAGAWRRASWTRPLVAALAPASLVVCVLGLPEAGAGIAVNLGILAALVVPAGRRLLATR